MVQLVDTGEKITVHYDLLRKLHSDFVKLPVQVIWIWKCHRGQRVVGLLILHWFCLKSKKETFTVSSNFNLLHIFLYGSQKYRNIRSLSFILLFFSELDSDQYHLYVIQSKLCVSCIHTTQVLSSCCYWTIMLETTHHLQKNEEVK